MNLDLEVGDVILGGKFKNKRIEVKSIGTDEIGQPIINGDRKLLAVRIEKTLPEGMWSSASLAEKYKENDMDKKAFLEQAYNSALQGELEKIALSGKTLASYARKKAVKNLKLSAGLDAIKGNKEAIKPGSMAFDLGLSRNRINQSIKDSRKDMSSAPIRNMAKSQSRAGSDRLNSLLTRLKG